MTVVLIFSIIAGAALALLLFMLRPTFDRPRTVMDVLGRPVLGAVTMIHNSEWRSRHRQALVAYGLAGIALIVAYVAVLAIQGMDLSIAELQKTIVGRG